MVKKKYTGYELNDDGTVGPDHEPLDGCFTCPPPDRTEEQIDELVDDEEVDRALPAKQT